MDGSNYWTRAVSRRRLLAGSAVGIAGLTLAGCTGSTATPTAAPPAPAATSGAAPAPTAVQAAPTPTAVRPKLGGTLRTMTTSAERNLEPHLTTGVAAGAHGAALCYSTLLTYKWGPDVKAPSYIPTGDLAESWTQTDDLTYVFKLRPNVKFHNIAPVNGRLLTADDIIYSYDRVRAQKAYASFLGGIIKMEAVDKTTLKLTLDKPNTDLLNNLGVYNLMIVARERVEQTNGNLDDPPVIGTGPFVFDSFTVNERVALKRNPDYFLAGRPYMDGFEALRSASDPSRPSTAFRGGAVNYLNAGVTPQIAEDIKKALPQTNVIYIPADRTQDEFVLNPNVDVFKDIRVRQAVNKAIDRKAIIDTVFLGHARLTSSVSLPDASYAIPDAELARLLARDLDGAKKLLKDAGKDGGIGFELMASTALSGAFVSAAELIQANLREAGITVTIRQADTPTYLAAQQNGTFQASVAAFAAGAPNSFFASRFYTGGAGNYVKYSDPEMDKLIDHQAVLVKDPEGRKKLVQDIQRKIISDAIYSPLVLHETPAVLAPEIKDFYPPILTTAHNVLWTSMWFDK